MPEKLVTTRKLSPTAARLAAVALLAVSMLAAPVRAGTPEGQNTADVAAIYRLQAAFHQAASFGGDINGMMLLWADDATLTVGTTVYSGKDQVRAFFANTSGAFKHYWVSLAPAFKTQIGVHGDTADLSYECHYADPSVTPYVLRSDVYGAGTLKKVNGSWLFWHIAAGSAPLDVAGSMPLVAANLNLQAASADSDADAAAIYRLQAAFHQAASFGGDINGMMLLWADDATLTVGTTVYSGKDQVRAFFANKSGAFKHYWISLARAFNTQIGVHGDTADLSYECHYADPSVTPYVLRSDVYGAGTVKKVNGSWLFWHVVAGNAPLPASGDLNADGQVTTGDAVLALRIALGSLTPSAAQIATGDVNGDGKVDVADAVIILRRALGL